MEMKLISKGKEYTVLYDDEDHESVSRYHWCIHGEGYVNGYIHKDMLSKRRYNAVLMHRLILGLTRGDKRPTDHKNHNRLDNRRCNIRICTYTENNRNMTSKPNSSSKYVGVGFNKVCQQWEAWITFNNIKIHLGIFQEEIDAAKRRDEAVKEYYGDFAYLNLK